MYQSVWYSNDFSFHEDKAHKTLNLPEVNVSTSSDINIAPERCDDRPRCDRERSRSVGRDSSSKRNHSVGTDLQRMLNLIRDAE